MENKVIESKGNNSFDVGNYREKQLYRVYKVLDASGDISHNTIPEFVDCRIYASRDYQTKYAIIWTSRGDGRGKAGGYGYNKDSSSVGAAIRDAGFTLDKRIDGVGDEAIDGALIAIAEYCGCKAPVLVKAYA